jgi:hypothetical protein
MRAPSAAHRSQSKWKMGYPVRRRQILRTALTRDAAPWGSRRECNVCRSSCRAWSTCEGVRVKMRESGRANKAERPVRSPWDRKWERLSWESAARAFARALTSESQPEHACTRAGSVGCRSHPCIRGTPTVSRSVSRFRRGPPALTTPAERVSRDGCPLPSRSVETCCMPG